MIKRSMVVTFLVVMGVLSAVEASARPPQPLKARFMTNPFTFVGNAGDCGEDSVAGEDTVGAAWVTHEGLPDAGRSDHALLLEKSGPGANCAAAGARVRPVRGITLTELGYDVRDDGDCGLDSPRVEVVMSGDGLHTIGCSDGTVTETLTDRRGQTWKRKRWTAADLANEQLTVPAIRPDSGTVVSITIVFDDGEDAGTGRTFLDNIDVNGVLMGKPGLGKAPAH